MDWKHIVILGLALAAGLAVPPPTRAQTVPEVTLEVPQIEYTRPSRSVLARRRAGWVQRLTYDLHVGPLRAGLTVSF